MKQVKVEAKQCKDHVPDSCLKLEQLFTTGNHIFIICVTVSTFGSAVNLEVIKYSLWIKEGLLTNVFKKNKAIDVHLDN